MEDNELLNEEKEISVSEAEEVKENAENVEASGEEVAEATSEEVLPSKEETKEQATKPEKKQKEKKVKEKKQKPIEDFSGLSDDEIYAKVETQRLLKRKKRTKIATLIALCFTFVIAVCLICFSTIPVGLYPKCVSKNYEMISFYPGTISSGFAFEDGTKGANAFNKVLDKSFSEVYLTAIFSGKLGEYEIEEKYATNFDDAISQDLVSSNTYYVAFEYGEDKVVLNKNGKKYVSKVSAKDDFDGTLKYKTAYLQVSDKDGFSDTAIYLSINNYPDSTKNKTVKITVRANTYEIFKAWSDLYDIYKGV